MLKKIAIYLRHSDEGNFEETKSRLVEYVKNDSELALTKVYVDEENGSEQFSKVIYAARVGKVDTIITDKFNTFGGIAEAMTYGSKLRVWDIGILFVDEDINTIDPDTELRLSIIRALKQDELRRSKKKAQSVHKKQILIQE